MAPDVEASRTDETQMVEKTPVRQKLYCCTGHVLNDLYLQMIVSFNLVYFIKVAQLEGSQVGLIMLIALAVNAVFGPIVGYCIDALTVPLISRALGRRKAWHLIGVIVTTVFFPLLYTPCFVCQDGGSSWAKFAYYLTILICINAFGFPNMEVGHLSVISVVAKNQRESVELSVLRTMLSYTSGILTYAVTWIMLRKGSREDLSPSSWKDFTIVNCILVVIGFIFSGMVFHIGTKEPKKPRDIEGIFTKQGLMSVAVIAMLGSNPEEEGGDVRKKSTSSQSSRKVSAVRKISTFLMPFDASILTKPDEVSDEEHTSGAVRKRSTGSQSGRKVSAVRKRSTYLMPFDAGILTTPDRVSDEEHTSDVVLYLADEESSAQPEEIGKQREGQHNEDNNEASCVPDVHGEVRKTSTSSQSSRKVSAVRKISTYLMPFDASILTKPDEVFDEEHTSGEVRKTSTSSQSSRKVSAVRKISTYLMPFDASILTKPDEVPDEEHTPDIVLYLADEERSAEPEEIGKQREGQHNDEIAEDNNEATIHGKSGTQDATRKSSFPRKFVNACHVVTDITRIPKTRRTWLKDPTLYRVSAIITITRLIVGGGYAYMPFYLTDYLLLQKESIAYFPLILLVSGLFGTSCSKLIEKKLGSKWTYCLAASMHIGTGVWLYFITRSTTYLTYPAAIMVGATSSTMSTMSLTYLTDLIGENQETAGFVCSFVGFMTRLTAGVFFMTVQNFYPRRSEDGGECEKCAIFGRYVYTLTLVVPTLLTFLIVLFFQKSNSSGNAGKRKSLDEANQSVVIINQTAHKDSATHLVRLTSYQDSLVQINGSLKSKVF